MGDAADRAAHIAICGMACRFPGSADPDGFWRNLAGGVESTVRLSEAELRASGVSAELIADPHYVRVASLLEDAERFDAGFFGYSPAVAAAMDPQHRVFLETVWEALESAGHPPAKDGPSIGVFAGAGFNHYLLFNVLERLEATHSVEWLQTLIGNDKDYLASRVSYKLDLRGPSLSVQTACSTSLVAVHVACQSLLAGECDLALAGGVSVRAPQRAGYLFEEGSIQSPDGHTRTFDARGRGTLFGSGAGVVVLRRLADAVADGDRIFAILRGSAVNNDGSAKVGFTAPSVEGQASVIAEAIGAAGVEPADIGYVEAHGTATPMGDSIEVAALRQVFRGLPRGGCAIGSVKSNVGHLEAAAGVAGLIKTILALGRGQIPPSLHFETPNPELRLDESPFLVPTRLVDWARRGGARLAGVSSFGIGGTNAHVVVEEPPAPAAPVPETSSCRVLVLSARTERALAELAERYAGRAAAGSDLDDLCYTSQVGRAHFEHRLALPGRDGGELAVALAEAARGVDRAGVARGQGAERPKVAFLFSGQGAQYAGMGRALEAAEPVFRDALERCDALVRPALGRPLRAILDDATGILDQTGFTQPALVALEWALSELWRSWGIVPDYVAGHSVGELAAAAACGILSLEECLALAVERGRLMQSLPAGGSMASVAAGPDVVAPLVERRGGAAAVAAFNAPRQTVISGSAAAVREILAELDEGGIRSRLLQVSHAFHSPLMDPILDGVQAAAGRFRPKRARVPIVLNLTAAASHGEELAEPGYFRRHAREPVRFDASVDELRRSGVSVFVEIGPHPVLVGMVAESVGPAADVALVASLRRGRDDRDEIGAALARLYSRGVEPRWPALHAGRRRRRVPAPSYPWQRERHWLERSRTPERAAEPAVEDRVYRIDWITAPRGAARPTRAGLWLVVGEASGPAGYLPESLERSGARAIRIEAAELDFADAGAVAAALSRRAAGTTAAGLVHLAGDGSATDEPRRVVETTATALCLARAAGRLGTPLWLATAGAAAPWPAGQGGIAHAALWGLGRVLALEHPETWGGLIDLEPDEPAAMAERLAAELTSGDGEDQVALGSSGRRVPRLVRAAAPSAPAPVMRGDAAYLITGGLGALGLAIAGWLAGRGARRVALCGRRGAGPIAGSPRVAEALQALEADGVETRIFAVDVADEPAMARVLAEIQAGGVPLRGVVHCAGVAEPASADDLDHAALEEALRSKAAGSLVLDRLTRGLELDFFAGFSSIASVLGSARAAHYAAANAALDAVVRGRRARGLAAVALHWGPWDGGGIAGGIAGPGSWLGSVGLELLQPAEALAFFGRLLQGPDPEPIVARIDWSRFQPVYEARRARPLIAGFGAPVAPPPAPAPLARELGAAAPAERAAVVQARVAAEAERILGVAPPIDSSRPLRDLGLDSLMAVELRNALAAALGLALPVTLIFDYPTVQDLARHLAGRLAPETRDTTSDGARRAAARPAVHPGAGWTQEPIAIVGMACRFPGGASSPDAFWELLREGRDAVVEVPPDRWDIEAYFDPDLYGLDSMNTRWGGFLDDVAGFDSRFFQLSHSEAAHLDPQQRLLLEVAWEALENAGLAAPRLGGSRTGVFVGASFSDYAQILATPPKRAGTGIALSIAANRISYFFDFRGPSLVVDTACSSSLVAVDLACQSLLAGRADLGLAGGVNMLLSPIATCALSHAGMMAPDGRCKTFDVAGNGYVRGEGCGLVVLKRLADARRDGDRILALIRATAVNQDGRSNGLTAPNGLSQQAVLREALERAGVAPRELGYVEAHGTGTALGDAIEIGALAEVLGEGRPAGSRCLVGSVKTNIGHLEAAAGVAGLIKTVLALRHRAIPANVHLKVLNPELRIEATALEIPAEPQPWPEPAAGAPRRAGVSSFGFGGTNAHLVLEEAAEVPEPVREEPERPRHLLVVSARTREGLRRQRLALARHLADHPEEPIGDLCFTAATGRAHFRFRLAVAAESSAELAARLGDPAAPVTAGEVPSERPRIAFLYSGQGAQYAGMTRELYGSQPVFRRALDCFDALAAGLRPGLLEVLLGADAERLDQTLHAQPALLAVELALTELWRSWGVVPDAVAGHSVGEYAAACAAGVLAPEEALGLVVERARLMQEIPSGGAMAMVPLPAAEVEPRLPPGVAIAAVNGPAHTVISGPESGIEAVLDALEQDYVSARRLRVSHAFHSPLIEPALERFEAAAARIRCRAPALPLASNVTGGLLDSGFAPDAAYWRRHARAPVRFHENLSALAVGAGCRVFLELGPSRTLAEIGRRAGVAADACWLASLERGESDWSALLRALAALHVRGVEIDWAGFDAPYPRRRRALPTYPFERERCWLEPGEIRDLVRRREGQAWA